MLEQTRHWLRRHPYIYDLTVRSRRIFGIRNNVYDLLNALSLFYGRNVRFIQVGSSNGLHSDPIREFVIRDKWSGVFVEPLPYSFEHLQNNYRYLRNPDLVFVNAAVVVSEQSDMAFWTFHEDFLAGLSEEEKINHLQKSSFKREHVIGFLGADVDTEQAIVEVHVPCLTLSELASRYLSSPNITLLITDCEGYESTLIPSIDFRDIAPEAILYESHNLGEQESVVGCFLADKGYQVFRLGGDAFAVKAELLARWRKSDAWIEEGLEAPDFSVGTERIVGYSIPGGGL